MLYSLHLFSVAVAGLVLISLVFILWQMVSFYMIIEIEIFIKFMIFVGYILASSEAVKFVVFVAYLCFFIVWLGLLGYIQFHFQILVDLLQFTNQNHLNF